MLQSVIVFLFPIYIIIAHVLANNGSLVMVDKLVFLFFISARLVTLFHIGDAKTDSQYSYM